MATKKIKSIKGRVARVTRLDDCGAPVFAECSVVTTKGFITVTWSHEYEKGDEYTQKNAWGEFCVNEKDPDILKWVPVKIEFCEVDPDVMDIIGGATPLIFSTNTIGFSFGPTTPTGAFALEVWTKKAGAACAGGTTEWGYVLFPFLKNGRLDGDVKIENAPLSFSMAAEGYGAPSDWGIGPHQDNPLKVITGMPVGDMWAMVVTDVQPPTETSGCAELIEPPDKGAVEPGDVFVADGAVTAESDAEGLTLVGLGYIVSNPANWASGEFMTIGTFKFNWNGTVWKAGIHA